MRRAGTPQSLTPPSSFFVLLLLCPCYTFGKNETVNKSSSSNSSSSPERLLEAKPRENTYEDFYPLVNKCCPFNWSYDDGKCIRNSKQGDNETTETDAPYWATPKTIVTLAKDFHTFNMTEVLGDPVVFRLSVGHPNCSTNRRVEVTHSDLVSAADTLDSVLALSPSGYLLWSDPQGSVHQIASDDFCIDQHKGESSYVAVFCAPLCDETHPCVKKCCNPEAVLYNNSCMLSSRQWEPFMYSTPGRRVQSTNSIHYKIGVPNCEYYSLSFKDEPYERGYLLLNGTLVLEDKEGKKAFHDPDTFCIDGSLPSFDNTGDYNQIVHYSGLESDQTVILCYPQALNRQVEDWRLMLYACVTLISSFFLLLTALVFIALWEYQNIHGWLQFCYVLSLWFAFTFLAVVQLSSESIQEVSSICCKMIGAFIHFLFLSAFFWLTSMNFDLWWTFSGCRPMRASTATGEKKRFICFALFSYGFPSLIAGVGLILDSFYRDIPYIITPRFGDRSCYFYGDKEKLPYFYAPVGLLLSINSVFFVSTIYSLHKLQNDTKFATKQSSKQEKKRFLLFMKLFVVMGVLWIFEVISWATMMFNHEEQYLKNIFLPTDLLIGSQGIAIFVIFTCKPNTCCQLEAQFRKFSQYLQKKRDESATESSPCGVGYIVAGLCIICLPVINKIRCLLSFFCHITKRRSLDTRRSNTINNTLSSAVWEKSRRSEMGSTTTNLDMELDIPKGLNNNGSAREIPLPETPIFRIP